MKVNASVRRICKNCRIVRRNKRVRKGGRNGTLYVICSDKRHKQRQG